MSFGSLSTTKFHGFGLGLRHEYYQELLTRDLPVDWFEIISENYIDTGGKPLYFLDQFAERYPIAMHGVSMNIGSADPLNTDYLKQLKALIKRIDPLWISDHCCWTGVNAHNSHDLLPQPYTDEVVQHFVEKIRQVQDYLERPILLENLSSYVSFKESRMTEWEFLSNICEEADCYLLLDINNIYVSARNHGFQSLDYIKGVPKHRVWQHHVAGHTDYGDYVIDTHDAPVRPEVFELYEHCLERFGPVSTMIERDDHYPPLDELIEEISMLRSIYEKQALAS